jgi:hypothetical protein
MKTVTELLKIVLTQKPAVLLGLGIFALSFLAFLSQNGSSISKIAIFLWGLLLLSCSLLIGHFIIWIFSNIKRWVRVNRNNKLLRDSTALSILAAIREEGNRIENDPLFSSGLVAPVDIKKIANDLNVSFDQARHFVIRFREANWLKYSVEDEIYGISDYGIKVLQSKGLI